MRRPGSRAPEDVEAVDVLLVEDDEEDAAADEVRRVLHELALEAMARRATWPGDPQPPPGPDALVAGSDAGNLLHRLARRYRRRAVTAAVLAVAVAVTTAVVDARQTAARAAALAELPGVLAPVSGRPTERWRVPGRVVIAEGEALLVVDGATLRGIDPTTGATAWTASAAAGEAAATGGCFPVDEGLLPDRAPVDDDLGLRGLVACVADAPGAASGDAPAGARVVVVDSTTGRTRHAVTTDGALLLAEPVDRDLLVTVALADGRVRVTRWDPATGEPRWDTTSPLPVLADGAAAGVERRPGSLTVGAFSVHLRTGEELDAERERGRPHLYEEHALPGGAVASWAWQAKGTSGRGTVSGGDASTYYLLPGPPLRPRLTDTSDHGVLVVAVRGDRLRGLDLRTGRMRWTRPRPGASELRATLLVAGVLLLDAGATVTALDVRTGDDLWRAPVDAEATDGPTNGPTDRPTGRPTERAALTDGRLVLLPVRADDGALHAVAHRIADGAPEWRTELPAGAVGATVVDHHLIVLTDDEVVGMG